MLSCFKHNSVYRVFFAVILFASSIAFISCKNHHIIDLQTKQHGQSLTDVILNQYYTKPDQVNALTLLLQQANIIAHNKKLHEVFPTRTDDQELLADIATLIEQTQEHFTIRKGTQERWEVKASQWMHNANQTELYQALDDLEVVNTITPSLKNVDALCILGCTLPNMKERAQYAEQLICSGLTTTCIIFLTGERPATANVDGNKKELEIIAQHHGVTALSETHLARSAYQASSLPRKISVHFIDTPAGNLPRATTETTCIELDEWLKQHPDITSILFISSQPNILYQKSIISEVLTHLKTPITFDVVGAETSSFIAVERLIGAVGSYLWAKTPAILDALNMTIREPLLQKRYKALYANNPLISKHIERLCISDEKPYH